MILTIITINRNNALGLEKTMKSVFSQTRTDFEYVVVDGASTDGSVGVIRHYSSLFGSRLNWVSEPDAGIYSAMNKGIQMASGDYVEFLNSGDCLVSNGIVGLVYDALERESFPSILYGNMLKNRPGGRIVKDKCFAGKKITFLGFFLGTLNHSPAFIRKSLFDKYGLYDESLRIASDWKWFLQSIVFGLEEPVYVDSDVTMFDMAGISEVNKELGYKERKKVLDELIPPTILSDYQQWALPIEQLKRIQRHPWADKLVWFIERCLFKWEKWFNKRSVIQEWR